MWAPGPSVRGRRLMRQAARILSDAWAVRARPATSHGPARVVRLPDGTRLAGPAVPDRTVGNRCRPGRQGRLRDTSDADRAGPSRAKASPNRSGASLTTPVEGHFRRGAVRRGAPAARRDIRHLRPPVPRDSPTTKPFAVSITSAGAVARRPGIR